MPDSSDLNPLRHSLAHLLGAALVDLYPDANLTIGPAVDNGFYYDADLPTKLSDADLPAIEERMRELAKGWSAFERMEVSPAEARERFAGNPYKLELIDEIESKGEQVTLYQSGAFVDLCRGGHVDDFRKVDLRGFALARVAGAYWRGDETKPQLTRVYGLAFSDKAGLRAYQEMLAQAAKRDHKLLGKQMGLFTFSQLVGSGLPLYLPKGMKVREAILKYLTELKEARDYQFVWTPHLGKESLYVQSGHLGKYDAMLPSIETEGGDRFVLKPMNCPHHFQVYAAEPKSYRDLPYRIAENATDYRNEKSGELNGLFRVRSLTQDDTHHMVRHDQIPSEIDMILKLVREVYEKFGFKNFRARVSVRDPKTPDAYFGTDVLWQEAEKALIDAVERWGVPHFIGEGEAAFYGPKIDIMIEDALGREWQLTTVQLDYVQPENFDLSYVNEESGTSRPAVLHVAILGSLDRFFAIATEHFGGAFPFWLAPVQARILPISDKFVSYGNDVAAALKAAGIRYEMPDAADTLGKRIRAAELDKVPLTVVIGEKEAADGTVSVRDNRSGAQETHPLEAFVKAYADAARTRSL